MGKYSIRDLSNDSILRGAQPPRLRLFVSSVGKLPGPVEVLETEDYRTGDGARR